MKDRLSIARRLLAELNIAGTECAFVSGSVGRGDDDEWSDIDLNICVADESMYGEYNLVFEGEIVQLHWIPSFTWEEIEQHPLHFRFLLESMPVYDPKCIFQSIKGRSSEYFTSQTGKQKTLSDWIGVVHERQKWAEESIQSGKMISAAIAGCAAWADAAFMFAYFEQESLSTGGLIPLMAKRWAGYQQYVSICRWLENPDAASIVRIVERYREYLRTKYPQDRNNYTLSPLQDILMGRKANRLVQSSQFANLVWQFSGEAFWLYLSTSDGFSIEDYLASFPQQLRDDLQKLGFAALEESEVRRLLELSDELIAYAQQQYSCSWYWGGGKSGCFQKK